MNKSTNTVTAMATAWRRRTEEASMKVCFNCKGEKTIDVEVFERRGAAELKSVVTLPCVGCNGKGEVSDQVFRQQLGESEIWCQCSDPLGQTRFFHDGEHPDLFKHHWRCGSCNKVVQIG